MNDQQIEQEIQAKGLTAPRVTPADVEAEIASEHYFLGGDGIYGAAHKAGDHQVQAFPQSLDLLTFCVLTLRNGFTVTGESACASPENFDAEIGRKIARQNALTKIWPLMGFRLLDQLAARRREGSANIAPVGLSAITSAEAFLEPDPERFTSNAGSGIVHDPLTGLDWSSNELEEADWDASAQACRDFRLGGFTDWRMPTDRELLTIVDRQRYNPCLPPIFKTEGESVWTSTQTPWSKDKAGSSRSFFVVHLLNGAVNSYNATLRLRVRPVRRGVPASQCLALGQS